MILAIQKPPFGGMPAYPISRCLGMKSCLPPILVFTRCGGFWHTNLIGTWCIPFWRCSKAFDQETSFDILACLKKASTSILLNVWHFNILYCRYLIGVDFGGILFSRKRLFGGMNMKSTWTGNPSASYLYNQRDEQNWWRETPFVLTHTKRKLRIPTDFWTVYRYVIRFLSPKNPMALEDSKRWMLTLPWLGR